MLYAIGCTVLVILSIFGIVHLTGEAVLKLMSDKSGSSVLIVRISPENEKDAEYIIRGAAERMKWFGKNFAHRIICVDCNISGEARQICSAVCEEYDFIEFMSINEASQLLKIEEKGS